MTREHLRQFTLSDEPSYQTAVAWMEETARSENRLTYLEDGITWHKNAEQLTRDGFFDRYLDTHCTPP